MKMVFAVDAEAPELFNWPLGNNGKISFKLDRLAPANGFAHEDAHDALADVEATIFIFKKIKEGVPDLFEKLIGAREKKIVSSALEKELYFNSSEISIDCRLNSFQLFQVQS
jgi:exodeoxyribonuclease I